MQVAALVLGGILAASIVTLARRFAAWWRWTAALAALPVPAGGHLLAGHMAALANSRHHHIVLRWDGEVGPIFCLPVFWQRCVVITHPELVHQLLRGSSKVDKSQSNYSVINPMQSAKGHPSLFSASTHSPYWRLVRKGTAPAFNMRCLRSGYRHIQDVCSELLGQLEALGPEQAFDVDNLLMRGTLDVIGRVGFETDFCAVQGFRATTAAAAASSQPPAGHSGPDGQDIFTIINESLKEVNLRWANPLRTNLLFWTPEVRLAERYWRAFQRHMNGVVADMRNRGQPGASDESISAHLLRLKDPHTGKPLSDDRLAPEVATFFVAGMDTTAHTMAWTLYLLAQHPEAEEKLCAELDALGLLATPERPQPRQVQFDDPGKLHYLAAVVKESMRVLPVSADGTAVEVPRDIQLGGYTIPANTMIWVHLFCTHNSPRYWQEPERFNPDRFLQPGAEYYTGGISSSGGGGGDISSGGGGGKASSSGGGDSGGGNSGGGEASSTSGGGNSSGGGANSSGGGASNSGGGVGFGGSPSSPRGSGAGGGQPLRFFPFSQGVRDCIGQSLARINYTATLAVLLGRYSFRLAPEAAGPGGVVDVVNLTLQAEHGVKMLARPRVRSHQATAAGSGS